MIFSPGELFEHRPASHQNAFDLFEGDWKSALPNEFGVVTGGSHQAFNATRVKWVADQLNGLTGKSVVELGPFEGYETFLLAEAGAKPLMAIEANRVNFVKCLVVKELLGFNANLLLGDFVSYLESMETRVDLCFASGVLYHQVQPLRFLKAAAESCENLFVWSHYYDEPALKGSDAWKHFNRQDHFRQTVEGYECEVYQRSYLMNQGFPRQYSGGPTDLPCWMMLDDIIGFLRHVGMDQISIRSQSETAAGPTVALLASRA